MKSKWFFRTIYIVWTILAIVLLIVVYFSADKSEWQPLVGRLAWIYLIASLVLTGILYRLKKKK